MFGFCVALSVQTSQASSSLLHNPQPLWHRWIRSGRGLLDPSTRGASVVELPDGLRILRPYGTLPHPNILGGFAFVSLLGPASLFLNNRKPGYLALLLFIPGIALLAITFHAPPGLP